MSLALMLRKLLACLALLTGLAAAGAPAQAEVASALASRIVASAKADPAAAMPASAVAPIVPELPAVASAPAFPRDARPALMPAGYIGSDRARE